MIVLVSILNMKTTFGLRGGGGGEGGAQVGAEALVCLESLGLQEEI